jgi:hypothetical protein
MDKSYIDTVRLLLRVAPDVFEGDLVAVRHVDLRAAADAVGSVDLEWPPPACARVRLLRVCCCCRPAWCVCSGRRLTGGLVAFECLQSGQLQTCRAPHW